MKKNRLGWIARYARGTDYHTELAARHERVISDLKSSFSSEKFLGCVDAQAVLERDGADRAGLGWIGKNTCLINQELGSFVFLSEILTTLELTPDKPVADHCGTCNRCLDACPTGALVAPGELDATRCISYWTIESKSPPPAELRSKFGGQFFGCDICQDVCPWNSKARRDWKSNHLEFSSDPLKRPLDSLVDLGETMEKDDYDIKLMLQGKALTRTKPQHFKENVKVALENLNRLELDEINRSESFRTT